MMQRRGSLLQRTSIFLALLLAVGSGALCSIQCGSATTSSSGDDSSAGAAGGGGSPTTVSIPAPIVTKITISDPVDGIVTITGTAGAVTGGNIVRAVNLTQTGTSKLELLLWGVAYAATTNETTAAADGSFSLQLTANIGDRIRITQLDASGTASTAVDITAPYEPLALGYTPLDIAVDPDSNTAYVLGVKNSLGVVTPVNLGSTITLGTEITLPTNCPSPTALDVYGAQNNLYVIDNANSAVCRQPQDGSAGSLFSGMGVTPINFAIHQASGIALITNNTSTAAIELSVADFGTGSMLPTFVTTPTQTQTATRAVAVGTDGTGAAYGLAIISYNTGDDYAFVVNLTAANLIGSGTQLSVGTPQEARIYNTNKALLTDSDGNAHILTINTTTGVVAIDRSITLGTTPQGVAINSAGTIAYVTNQGSDTLSVIDLTAGAEAVSRTITLADGPTQLIFKGGDTSQTAVIHNTAQNVIVLSN